MSLILIVNHLEKLLLPKFLHLVASALSLVYNQGADGDMRLLRTDTSNGLHLDNFELATTPPYAILSHRWGPNEVLYGDLKSESPKDGDRFSKLMECCMRAREDGYSHVWIDTCCINWESKAEVSQSINSMFLWYARTAVCYVHLNDVDSTQNPESEQSTFRASEWFKRGWTLQELIAPWNVVFLTKTWGVIGNKRLLASTIEQITNVSCAVLRGSVGLEEISVAEKMSWASNRSTTRNEDRAYSLLGIFGVNMTTTYGEGHLSAFQRLQYEIIRKTNDYSIFAWDVYSSGREEEICGLLAPSPDAFANSAGIVSTPLTPFANRWGYALPGIVVDIQTANSSICLKVPIFATPSSTGHSRHDACVIAIPCKKRDTYTPDHYSTIGVVVRPDSKGYYSRLSNAILVDAHRLANSGIQWNIETIDILFEDDKPKHSRVSSVARQIMLKTYQVVLKARTLDALSKSYNVMSIYNHDFAHVFVDSALVPPEWYTIDWVKDPQTEEYDCIVTVQYPSTAAEDHIADQESVHYLEYRWKWGDMMLTLEIVMVADYSLVCGGCRLSCGKLYIDTIDFDTAQRTKYRWSMDVHNEKTVDVILTIMGTVDQTVHYELDVAIRESQASTSNATSSQRPAAASLEERFLRGPQGIVSGFEGGNSSFQVGDNNSQEGDNDSEEGISDSEGGDSGSEGSGDARE